jgi:dienelactone hydrolase
MVPAVDPSRALPPAKDFARKLTVLGYVSAAPALVAEPKEIATDKASNAAIFRKLDFVPVFSDNGGLSQE